MKLNNPDEDEISDKPLERSDKREKLCFVTSESASTAAGTTIAICDWQ